MELIKYIIQYIIENKEWIFSGIGVLIISVIYYLLTHKRKTDKIDNSNYIKAPIKIKKGDSNSIQIINNQNNYQQTKSKSDLTDEVTISLKKVYQLLDILIESVEIGLAPVKFNSTKTYLECLNEATKAYFDFYDYYKINDILFDSEINESISEIKNLMESYLSKQKNIEGLKSMNISQDIINKNASELYDMYKSSIQSEIPRLRKKLRDLINRKINNNVP